MLVSLRLPSDLVSEVEDAARLIGCPPRVVVQRALRHALDTAISPQRDWLAVRSAVVRAEGWLDLQCRLRAAGYVFRLAPEGGLWLHDWPGDRPLVAAEAMGLSLAALCLRFRAGFPGATGIRRARPAPIGAVPRAEALPAPEVAETTVAPAPEVESESLSAAPPRESAPLFLAQPVAIALQPLALGTATYPFGPAAPIAPVPDQQPAAMDIGTPEHEAQPDHAPVAALCDVVPVDELPYAPDAPASVPEDLAQWAEGAQEIVWTEDDPLEVRLVEPRPEAALDAQPRQLVIGAAPSAPRVEEMPQAVASFWWTGGLSGAGISWATQQLGATG